MSAFLQLRDAVVAVLSAPPALAGGFIHAGRAFALPAEQAQGIFVRLSRGSGAAPHAGDGRVDWDTEIMVNMAARAAPGGDGEAAVDALLSDVYARLAATQPPGNADAWLAQPAVVFDVDEADQTMGAAGLRLRINHRTASADLSAAD